MLERNNDWLNKKLELLLKENFADVEIINPISVEFGRKSKTRFGSIRLTEKKVSKIIINGYFKDNLIPEFVILATLAHELAHYVHGFSSLRPQLYKHPHKGNVVGIELKKRGLAGLELEEKIWSKKNWHLYIKNKDLTSVRVKRTIKRKKSTSIRTLRGLAFIEGFLQKYRLL